MLRLLLMTTKSFPEFVHGHTWKIRKRDIITLVSSSLVVSRAAHLGDSNENLRLHVAL